MHWGIIGQAAGLFAVTNIDDIVLLSLFFAHGAARRGSAARVVTGQYLGFAAILAVAMTAALGASFLPKSAIPYLGLLPLALGLKATWQEWKNRRRGYSLLEARKKSPETLQVATVTFANGGDNIAAYVPVFATAGVGGMSVYAVVFLALVALWCAAGRFFATRSVIARALRRWNHILLPLALIALGLLILTEGGAFGL